MICYRLSDDMCCLPIAPPVYCRLDQVVPASQLQLPKMGGLEDDEEAQLDEDVEQPQDKAQAAES